MYTPGHQEGEDTGADEILPFDHVQHGFGYHVGTLHEAVGTAQSQFRGNHVMGALVNGRLLSLPAPPAGQGTSYHLPPEIASSLLSEYSKHAGNHSERPHPGTTRAAREVLQRVADAQAAGTSLDWRDLVPSQLVPMAGHILKHHRYDGVELPSSPGASSTHTFFLSKPAQLASLGTQGQAGALHTRNAQAIENMLAQVQEGQPYPRQLANDVADLISQREAGGATDLALARARTRLDTGSPTYPAAINGVEDLHTEAVHHLAEIAREHHARASTAPTPQDYNWESINDSTPLSPEEEQWAPPTIHQYDPPSATPSSAQPGRQRPPRGPRQNRPFPRRQTPVGSAPPLPTVNSATSQPSSNAPSEEDYRTWDNARIAHHARALHLASRVDVAHSVDPLLAHEIQSVLAERMQEAAQNGDTPEHDLLQKGHARLDRERRVRKLMNSDPTASALAEAIARTGDRARELQSHLIDHQGEADPLQGLAGNRRNLRPRSGSPAPSSSSSSSSPSSRPPVAARAAQQAPRSALNAQLAAPLSSSPSSPSPAPASSSPGSSPGTQNGPARSLLLDDLANPPADLERRGLHVPSPDLHDAVKRAGWRDLEQARAHMRALQHGEETHYSNHVVGDDHFAPLVGSHGTALYLHPTPEAADRTLRQGGGPSLDGKAPPPDAARARAGVAHGVPVRVAGRLLDLRGTNGVLPSDLHDSVRGFLGERAQRYADLAAQKRAGGNDLQTVYDAEHLRAEGLRAARLARELGGGGDGSLGGRTHRPRPLQVSEMARFLGHGATNEMLTHLGYTGLKTHDPQTGHTHTVLFSDEHLAPDTPEIRSRLDQLTPAQRQALLAHSAHDLGGHDYNYFAHTPYGPDLRSSALGPSPLLAGAVRTGTDHTQGPVKDTLDELSARMAHNTREEGHVIDARGHVVASTRGGEGSFRMHGNPAGLVVVHSHPVGARAAQLGRSSGARALEGFSREDLADALGGRYAASVVVQNGKRYTLSPSNPTVQPFTPEHWDQHIAPLYDQAHVEVTRDLQRAAGKRKSKEYQEILETFPHRVMQKVASNKKAGLRYQVDHLSPTLWTP